MSNKPRRRAVAALAAAAVIAVVALSAGGDRVVPGHAAAPAVGPPSPVVSCAQVGREPLPGTQLVLREATEATDATDATATLPPDIPAPRSAPLARCLGGFARGGHQGMIVLAYPAEDFGSYIARLPQAG
ncbi:MAG: hypothetical protein ACR2LF_05510 [Jatrophihabitantaceae bacterium]